MKSTIEKHKDEHQLERFKNDVEQFKRKYTHHIKDDWLMSYDETQFEYSSHIMNDLLHNIGTKKDIRLMAFYFAFEYDRYKAKFQKIEDVPSAYKQLKKDYANLVDRFNTLLQTTKLLIPDEEHSKISTFQERLPF